MRKKTKKKQNKDPMKGINKEIQHEIDSEQLNKDRTAQELKEEIFSKDSSIIDDFEQQISSNEPIRELFTPKNIKFKSQLTEEQRNAVSILYHAYKTLYEKWGIHFEGLKFVLDEYIDFGVSVDRQGRSEYVDAHKSQMLAQQMQNQSNMTNQVSQLKMN